MTCLLQVELSKDTAHRGIDLMKSPSINSPFCNFTTKMFLRYKHDSHVKMCSSRNGETKCIYLIDFGYTFCCRFHGNTLDVTNMLKIE